MPIASFALKKIGHAEIAKMPHALYQKYVILVMISVWDLLFLIAVLDIIGWMMRDRSKFAEVKSEIQIGRTESANVDLDLEISRDDSSIEP